MNISKFTQKSVEAVQNCEKLAYEYGNQQIDQEHLLYSLLTVEDSLIFKLITKMGISGDQFRDEVQQAIGKLPKVSGGQVYFSNDANKVLVNAEDEAKAMGDEYVSVEHLFLAMLKQPNKAVKELFRLYGITKESFLQALSTVRGNQRVVSDNPEATYDTLNKYGYKLDLHDGIKNNPYLSQKKLYKGASKDYLDNAKAWNTEVKRYNENVKQHIELEPIQLKNYISIKQEVLENVKEANAEEKKITPKAIELVHEMADWVMETLRNLKVYIKRKSREYEAAKAWNGIKDRFNDMFKENKRLDDEIKSLSNQIEDLNHLDHEFTEVIDSKLSLIHDIEEQDMRQKEKLSQLKVLEPEAYKDLTQEEYRKEIKGLSFEERIDKATSLIEEHQRMIERSRGYEIDI